MTRPLLDRVRFVLAEALNSVTERPLRTLISVVAFTLGAAGLTAALVVGASATAAVRADLTPSQLDTIRLRTLTGTLDARDVRRVRALEDVRSVGVESLPWADAQVIGRRAASQGWLVHTSARVVATDAAYLDAVRAIVSPTSATATLGAPWSDRIAIIGTETASELGITAVAPGIKVWIGNTGFDVAGIASDADRDPSLRRSVIIAPTGVPRLAAIDKEQTEMVVITSSGRAAAVSLALPAVLRPANPGTVRISDVLDIRAIREGVATLIAGALAWVGVVMALLAVAIVAATNYISVLSRRAEIGLRRCIGGSRVLVGGIFLGEGAIVGLAGGVAGSAIGAVVGFVIARTKEWPPVYAAWYFALGPLLGLVAGMFACLWPAWRAARVPPASAIRME